MVGFDEVIPLCVGEQGGNEGFFEVVDGVQFSEIELCSRFYTAVDNLQSDRK